MTGSHSPNAAGVQTALLVAVWVDSPQLVGSPRISPDTVVLPHAVLCSRSGYPGKYICIKIKKKSSCNLGRYPQVRDPPGAAVPLSQVPATAAIFGLPPHFCAVPLAAPEPQWGGCWGQGRRVRAKIRPPSSRKQLAGHCRAAAAR